jgi:DNA-binding NarL/FixJ family response regulator
VEGRSTFSSELLPHLVDSPRGDAAAVLLTPREHDILALLAAGRTNRSIAEALALSDGTVRVYVSTVLAKLGAANRTEATVLAIRQGLVDTPGEAPQRSPRRDDDPGVSGREPS